MKIKCVGCKELSTKNYFGLPRENETVLTYFGCGFEFEKMV
jgi:hypothetical protein